ncbi:MAG: TraR/DksA C4-type zinc finger protein [Pseudomonadota bacterium]
MKESDLDFYRNLLISSIDNLNKEKILDLDDVAVPQKDKGDEVDESNSERDNLLSFKLRGREDFLLKKIKAALQRIKEGSFGLCDECGEQIESSRLEARPTATSCLHCKEEQERAEGHIPYERKSHTLGKGLILSNAVGMEFD